MTKIYTDDPLVRYKGTTVSIDRTRIEIDAQLRAFNVQDIHWHWNPEGYDIYVQFAIQEEIDNVSVNVVAKVKCPTIWDKGKVRSPKRENRTDKINLQVSMRAMHWFIKTHLESAYAMQSTKVAGFLPNIITPSGHSVFDVVKQQISRFPALEAHEAEEMTRIPLEG